MEERGPTLEHNPYAAPAADVTTGHVDPGAELAGRGTRLLASIIDGLLMLAVLAPLLTLGGYWDRVLADGLTLPDQLMAFVAGTVAFLLLNGYLLARRGQTIGKLLCRIRIVSSLDGQLLPFTRMVTHRLLPVQVVAQLPAIGQLLTLVDCLFIFREDRRCVHDLIAGTIVIRAGLARTAPTPAA